MKRIWKYPLLISDTQILSLPEDHEFLLVDLQGGTPMLWAMVDPTGKYVSVQIHTLGTGEPVPEGLCYIGSYQMMGGDFVGHVFVEVL